MAPRLTQSDILAQHPAGRNTAALFAPIEIRTTGTLSIGLTLRSILRAAALLRSLLPLS